MRMQKQTQTHCPCALPRRFAAMLYDGLLLVALWMAAAAVVVVISGDEVPSTNWLFQVYLVVVTWAYLAVCWRAGQTLGMKAWRILITADGYQVTWTATMTRFAVALLSWLPAGLGFWWSLFHRKRATWHDLASGTQLVVLPKIASKTPEQDNTQTQNQDRGQEHRKP